MNAVPLVAWWNDRGNGQRPGDQAALYFAMQNPLSSSRALNRYPDAKFPHGIFFFNAMLNIGWGDTYTTLFSGVGPRQSRFSRTTLLFSQYNSRRLISRAIVIPV